MNRKDKTKPVQIGESPVARVCKMVIWAALGLAVFYTPLLNASKLYFPFVAGKGLFFMAMAQIAFFAWVILAIHDPQYRPKKNLVFWAVVAFVAIFALTSLTGVDFERSFWGKYERMTGLLFMLHLFAFFIVLASFLQKKKDWEIFVGISMVSATIIAFMVTGESLRIIEPLSSGRGATLGNTTFAAVYMLFNAYLALYFFVASVIQTRNSAQKYTGKKALFAGIFIVITVALLVGTAKAAVISFFAGLGLLALLYLAFQAKKNILRKAGIAGLITSVIGGITAFALVFREGSIVNQWWVRLATEARFVVWNMAWQGFLERPLFGWGPQNFEMPFYKYFNPCLYTSRCGGETWFDSAHSIFLDALVMTGALGFAAFVFLLLATIFILWKKYFREETRYKTLQIPEQSSVPQYQSKAHYGARRDRQETNRGTKNKHNEIENGTKMSFWLAAIITVLLAVYALQGLTVFDMPTSYMMLFIVFGLAAAMVGGSVGWRIGRTENEESFVAASHVRLYLIAPILIVFAITFTYSVIQPYRANKYTIEAATSPLGSEQRLEAMQKALSVSSMGNYQLRAFLAEGTISRLGNEKELQQVSQEAALREAELAIDILKEGLKINPDDLRLQLYLARLYIVLVLRDLDIQKYAPLAKEASERAVEISPTHLEAYWNLAQSEIYNQDYDAAEKAIDTAIALEPSALQSHLLVINLAALKQDTSLVQKRIDAALKVNPEWKEILQKFIKT